MGDGACLVRGRGEGAKMLERGKRVDVDLAGRGTEEEVRGGKREREGGDGIAGVRMEEQARIRSAVLKPRLDPAPGHRTTPSIGRVPTINLYIQAENEKTHLMTTAPSPPVVRSMRMISPAPPPPRALTLPFPLATAETGSSSSPPSSPVRLSNSRTANTSLPADAQNARSRGSNAIDVGGAGRW